MQHSISKLYNWWKNYLSDTRINWLSDYEFNDLSNLFITTLLFSILSTLLSGFRTDPLHSLGFEYCFIIKKQICFPEIQRMNSMNHPIHLWGAPYGNISVLLSLNNSAKWFSNRAIALAVNVSSWNVLGLTFWHHTSIKWLSDNDSNQPFNRLINCTLLLPLSLLTTLLSGFQTDSFHSLGTGCLF